MAIEAIEVKLQVSFATMLTAKLHRWFRRNLWLYLVVVAMLSYALSILHDAPFGRTFMVYAAIVLSVSLTTIVLSAAVLARKLRHRAGTLSLEAGGGHLVDRTGSRDVTWDWLGPAKVTGTYFVLRRAGNPGDLIFIRRGGPSLPTAEHEAALRQWLVAANQLR